MNATQREVFGQEIALARRLMSERRHDEAFPHPERAHILGQAHVRPHVMTHWLMLRIAVHRRQAHAAWGQVARIVLGAIGSAVGSVPIGNTGGSDISMFKRMPIAPELQRVIDGSAPDPAANAGRSGSLL